jgi:hypothetical protein
LPRARNLVDQFLADPTADLTDATRWNRDGHATDLANEIRGVSEY